MYRICCLQKFVFNIQCLFTQPKAYFDLILYLFANNKAAHEAKDDEGKVSELNKLLRFRSQRLVLMLLCRYVTKHSFI
jgi:hypothetical protein